MMTPRNAANLPGSLAYAVHLLCVCHATVALRAVEFCQQYARAREERRLNYEESHGHFQISTRA